MSTEPKLSREEYLKRYLSRREHTQKKKKGRPKNYVKKKHVGLKIVDDDVGLNSIEPEETIDDEIGDEAPIVAEVIDERPSEVKIKELYESSRWKKLGDENDIKSDKSRNFPNVEQHETEAGSIPVKKSVNSRQRHDSDSDESPIQKSSANDSESNSILLHSGKHTSKTSVEKLPASNSASQFSKHSSETDLSPVKMCSYDSDLSPPRYSHKSEHELPSPQQSHKSDSDLSPPRSLEKYDSDLSPPRTLNQSVNDKKSSKMIHRSRSEHSKKKRFSFSKEKIQNSDSDMSPPRKSAHIKDEIKNRPTSTASGFKAGLQAASLAKEQIKIVKEMEMEHMKNMNEELIGCKAETVFRDRATGKKRNLEEERRKQKKEEEKNSELKEKYVEWGKGLRQREEQKKRFENDAFEMTKPLARYCDDNDLENVLKEQERAGDPMLEYIRKKKQKAGLIVPKYSGPPPPPNRFDILPGYRWDGVDRSNGFEKRYFEKLSSGKAREEEAHLWSVQNM